jgi:hypothetical protein
MKAKDLSITAAILTIPYFAASLAVYAAAQPQETSHFASLPSDRSAVARAEEAKPEPTPQPTPEPKPKTNQEIIRETAIKYEVAPHDLLAIAQVESSYNCDSVGDGGGSYGCFQINIKDSYINGRYHKAAHAWVTPEQAKDVTWAADWTAKRLIAKGYQANRERAIRMHNGDPTIQTTKNYYNKVNAAARQIKEQ